ncbi:hypothetical protein ACJ73_04925 [Blastomyces percursus]|uniref:BCS1 N-terminal domain-containing protein n=1 Tax=Blastomyces percursus TaxID=1658174 RepID=A0A1J9R7W4_9EURO|nr:hypothetical protein ACJ73_04925 [Blastomyces percursus]
MPALVDPITMNDSFSATPMSQPGTAVLDAFVPGYSFFSRLFSSYFHVDLSPYLLIVAFVAIIISPRFHSLTDFLSMSIEIPSNDELFCSTLQWLSKTSFFLRSSSVIAETNTRGDLPWSNDDGKDSGSDVKDTPKYTPTGKNYFFSQGRLFCVERIPCEAGSRIPWAPDAGTKIRLTCFPGSLSAGKRLIDDIMGFRTEHDSKHVTVFTPQTSLGQSHWKEYDRKPPRDLSTVALDPGQKAKLLKSIEDYLHPATRCWHHSRGSPYRRGYLFSGPPGTGKTSLAMAVASKLHLKIYLLNLGSITERQLTELFGKPVVQLNLYLASPARSAPPFCCLV